MSRNNMSAVNSIVWVISGWGYRPRGAEEYWQAAVRSKVFQRLAGSLTAKLVVILGVLVLVGGSTFWYISVQNDRKNLMDNTIAFVSSFSEIMKKSLRKDMLLFHRENIQETLESIGALDTIAKVQILDARGLVVNSSDKGDLGHRIDHDSRACVGCHEDSPGPREMLRKDKRWAIHTDPAGLRTLSFVEPIYNEPDCYTAVCHAHGREQKVLGILITDFSLQPIDMKIRSQMIDTSVYMFLFLAASSVMLYSVLWKFVLRPVNSLSGGMEKVTKGNLTHRVPAASGDEIGRLTHTFNTMAEELGGARKSMERWNQSLEDEVRKKTDEIMATQKKLVQAEKLAALGRLTADVAHEIRNPLTALGGYARRLHRMLFSPKEKEYAGIIVSEVHRLEKVLRDILTFSRDVKTVFEKVSVNHMVRDSIVSFSAVCDEHAIKIEERLEAEFQILIDTNQARQAVNNLISNAIDAMPEGGSLSVEVALEQCHGASFVVVHVSDTGTGIPEDRLQVVFEPFYTTKEIGRGTGLGLAISRKVMEEHGGFIIAKNRKEGGLTVSLYFPYQSREELCRMPCWEFMKCGRNAGTDRNCPVYPHFGRVCWVVGGTYCEGKVQGTFAQKCESCGKCPFYQKVLSGEI